MLKLLIPLFLSTTLISTNWVFMIFTLSFLFLVLSICGGSYQMSIYSFILLDNVSMSLTMLSLWVCILMLLSSFYVKKNKNSETTFLLVVTFLMSSLILAFTTSNFLMFYITFETSLIPTALLILGWGYQPERWQAFIYLLFYTLFASLPLLVAFFWIYKKTLTLEILLLSGIVKFDLSPLFLGLTLAFLVKLPVYFCHLWLPKAHVEAPIAGSMILAGVLLKLGGYGLLRCLSISSSSTIKLFDPWFMSVMIWGGVFSSLICLRQNDMKSLIAYSSVAHMSIVAISLFTLFYSGWFGALLMMIAHGLISSALFCLANFAYERSHSRSLIVNKGLINFNPSMSLMWFLMIACSMAAPPSLNFLSEIIMVGSCVSFSTTLIIPLVFISFLSAAYSLYLFSNTQHGNVSSLYLGHSNKVSEFSLISLHLIPAIIMPSYLSMMFI